ncbi:hypothetical protein [Umezawaea sp.]|uniref:hypothetical protein n=1 Tax=Umezawaea sp. TaxID=1955258 RepID=UPI002ED19695
MDLGTRNRAILVVDIEKSSERTDPRKAALRAALYGVLGGALRTMPPHRVDDLGDGVLAVFDSDVLPVLDPLVGDLVQALWRHNATVDPPEWMRLRLGVHFGLVARDPHGWVGDALTTAFRIVNGAGVKAVLRAAPRAQSIVVLSDAVHQTVVRPGYAALQPETYRDLLDDGRRMWIRVPGYATPPVATGAPAAEPVRVEAPPAKSISIKARGNVFTADTIGTVDARVGLGPAS